MIEYDPHDWRSHLFDIKGSMLKQISSRILAAVVWSAVVTAGYEYWHNGVKLADRLPLLPLTVHALIGTAIGLLLVFRTNSSYDRFWEGRRMWGSMLNESRNLARSASVLLASVPDVQSRLLGWTMAFPHAVMHQLRGSSKNLGNHGDRLAAADVQRVLSHDHVPLAVAREMTRNLVEAKNRQAISEYLFVALDQNVQLLIDYVGACERIQKTPMPFAYMVHLRRVILLYCYSLPLALVREYDWWTIPATFFVAFVLLGIEEIGVEIENPFGNDDNDLPLESFCESIRRSVEEMGKTSTESLDQPQIRQENTNHDQQ